MMYPTSCCQGEISAKEIRYLLKRAIMHGDLDIKDIRQLLDKLEISRDEVAALAEKAGVSFEDAFTYKHVESKLEEAGEIMAVSEVCCHIGPGCEICAEEAWKATV